MVMTMAYVVIDKISKDFRARKGEVISALNNVTFDVSQGELLVLLGPSGSGKTTLLRMIAGLEQVDQGTISIDQRTVNNVEPKNRDVAMVFQNHALYPHMTVYENIAFPLRLRHVPTAEIKRSVDETADLLGIGGLLERGPEDLSGGERQRVALSRAIVRKPKLFLFDEPLSQLDAPLRAQMRAEIARVHARLGTTMIYVTHDQAEAMTLGQRLVVLKKGEVQQVGNPMTIYNRPTSMFVAGFVGAPMNVFSGWLLARGKDLLFCAGINRERPDFEVVLAAAQAASLQPYLSKRVVLGLRPEHILLEFASDAPGKIAATVQFVQPLGAETFVDLEIGISKCTLRTSGDSRPPVGKSVMIAFNLAHARFFDPDSQRSLGC
jgi:multiple sugar transport system ATP-binding protein